MKIWKRFQLYAAWKKFILNKTDNKKLKWKNNNPHMILKLNDHNQPLNQEVVEKSVLNRLKFSSIHRTFTKLQNTQNIQTSLNK